MLAGQTKAADEQTAISGYLLDSHCLPSSANSVN